MKRNGKKTSKFTALLLCVLLISSTMQSMRANATGGEKPSVSAKAAFLLEANTGTVLYEKNENTRMGPASTTKIVTAIVTLENTSLEQLVEITPQMTGIEGSSLYLKADEQLTVRDLLYGLMLRSANDAAIALAIHTAGDVESFVDMMNDFAARLGLYDTHFENPHGLDGDTHYTTARELALIAAYASKNPTFCEIVSTKKIIIAKSTESARLVVNHNKLLSAYEGCVGVKTGFTKKCGRTLVSAFFDGGMYLIAVTLNAPDDWSDHRKLYDYARACYQMTEAIRPYDYTRCLGVLGGESDTVEITNAEGAVHFEKRSDMPFSVTVRLPRILVAPIGEGEAVGELLIQYADGAEASVPLIAKQAIAKRKKHLF